MVKRCITWYSQHLHLTTSWGTTVHPVSCLFDVCTLEFLIIAKLKHLSQKHKCNQSKTESNSSIKKWSKDQKVSCCLQLLLQPKKASVVIKHTRVKKHVQNGPKVSSSYIWGGFFHTLYDVVKKKNNSFKFILGHIFYFLLHCKKAV